MSQSVNSEISIQRMLDEIDVIGLGLKEWIRRADKGEIKRDGAIIEMKRAQLNVLRAIRVELERLK